MDVAVSNQARQLENTARRFVINVTASAQRAYEVRSCEITSDAFRNRTSFQSSISLEDVFADDIAAGLRSCLSKLSGDTEVVALPNYVLEIPGLTLAGAQLVATRTQEDILHIIIRFRFFVGGINNVFRSKLGFDDTVNDHAANLSVRVLADIALPFLNICEAYRSGMVTEKTSFTEFVAGLSERSQELRFQVELLKRFVDSKDKTEELSGPNSSINIRQLSAITSDIDEF
ncbi:MAG: hypothetical protein AAFW87_03905 [Pseudomonadota bacterium]